MFTSGLILFASACMFAHTAASTVVGSVTLDVDHTYNPISHTGLLVINCSVDSSLANMETVATLTVLGSKPYGAEDEFDQLSTVDMWSQTPILLSNEMKDANVTISGQIGIGNPSQSYLLMSWNSPKFGYQQYYKCVANGIGHKEQAKSAFAIAKMDLSGLGGGCCKTVDAIDSQLRLLSEKLGSVSSAQGELKQHVQSLPNKIEALEAKLEEVQLDVSCQIKLSDIDKSKFDTSDRYGDRLYAVSKEELRFDIYQNNQDCKALGGYLLEIDDDKEYQFVYELVNKIKGANTFWTGGNDIDKEGTFVYYNSKKPVPKLSGWSRGQPNNSGGNEDCMEIKLSYKGLNDLPCSHAGKFVCELPLK